MGLLQKKVLISLHGIRTRGVWQRNLCPLVSEKGWKYYPLDYGHFQALQLLQPWCHKAKVNWFRDEINRITSENPSATPSIIVHSFGSLILAEALKKFTDLKFDKIILTGSIMPRDMSWSNLVSEKQVGSILNITSKKDFWAKVARYCVWGASDTGVRGFEDEKTKHFSEVSYENFGHSDSHSYEIFSAQVVPFLEKQSDVYKVGASENYLTFSRPLEAASWTAVTYVRQFVDRFQDAVRDGHFYNRTTKKKLDINPPNKLIVLIPSKPADASKDGRNQLIKRMNLTPVAFGATQERTALMGVDGAMYDLPSGIETFNVYREKEQNPEASKEAVKSFEAIMESIALEEAGDLESPFKIQRLSEFILEQENV